MSEDVEYNSISSPLVKALALYNVGLPQLH